MIDDTNDIGTYRSLVGALNNEIGMKIDMKKEFNKEESLVPTNNIEYLDCHKKNGCECLNSSYQGEVKSNVIGSNSILIIEMEFSSGNMIKQITDSIFTLEERGIYQVGINVKLNLKEEGSFRVYPRINGNIRKDLSCIGNNNLADLCAEASRIFLIDAMQECLYLDFLVNTQECSTILEGSVCIVKVV